MANQSKVLQSNSFPEKLLSGPQWLRALAQKNLRKAVIGDVKNVKIKSVDQDLESLQMFHSEVDLFCSHCLDWCWILFLLRCRRFRNIVLLFSLWSCVLVFRLLKWSWNLKICVRSCKKHWQVFIHEPNTSISFLWSSFIVAQLLRVLISKFLSFCQKQLKAA